MQTHEPNKIDKKYSDEFHWLIGSLFLKSNISYDYFSRLTFITALNSVKLW
jgi:hypothetical protein